MMEFSDGDNNPNAIAKQPKRHNGTSCHQCKNIKTDSKLAFCTHMFDKRSKPEKRRCRKKYCSSCLQKFYNLKLENTKNGWTCMSCRALCVCAACTRKDNLASPKMWGGLALNASSLSQQLFMMPPHQQNMYMQQLMLQQAQQQLQHIQGDEEEEPGDEGDEDDQSRRRQLKGQQGYPPAAGFQAPMSDLLGGGPGLQGGEHIPVALLQQQRALQHAYLLQQQQQQQQQLQLQQLQQLQQLRLQHHELMSSQLQGMPEQQDSQMYMSLLLQQRQQQLLALQQERLGMQGGHRGQEEMEGSGGEESGNFRRGSSDWAAMAAAMRAAAAVGYKDNGENEGDGGDGGEPTGGNGMTGMGPGSDMGGEGGVDGTENANLLLLQQQEMHQRLQHALNSKNIKLDENSLQGLRSLSQLQGAPGDNHEDEDEQSDKESAAFQHSGSAAWTADLQAAGAAAQENSRLAVPRLSPGAMSPLSPLGSQDEMNVATSGAAGSAKVPLRGSSGSSAFSNVGSGARWAKGDRAEEGADDGRSDEDEGDMGESKVDGGDEGGADEEVAAEADILGQADAAEEEDDETTGAAVVQSTGAEEQEEALAEETEAVLGKRNRDEAEEHAEEEVDAVKRAKTEDDGPD